MRLWVRPLRVGASTVAKKFNRACARCPNFKQPRAQRKDNTVASQQQTTEHTNDHPFCDQPSHDCHEDQEKIQTLYEQYQDGFVTEQERDNIYGGKAI